MVELVAPLKPRPEWAASDDPQLLLLRYWQSKRLIQTYQDFKETDKYDLAYHFFLEDIYSPTDFGELHEDIDRIYRIMSSALPQNMLRAISTTVELYNLSEELDQIMLRTLIDKVGMTDMLNVEMYAEGYRLCDNYVERVKQLDLIVRAGHEVEALTRIPLVSTTIRLTKTPAYFAGWQKVHAFLERGLAAFLQSEGSQKFFTTIYEREMTALDNMFSSEPNPFGFENIYHIKELP